jgi:hypothetical protein
VVGKGPQHWRLGDNMGGEGDGVGLGQPKLAALSAQIVIENLLKGINRRGYICNLFGGKNAGQYKETQFIKVMNLLGR